MKKRTVVVICIAASSIAYAAYSYCEWLDQVRYLRWTSSRQEALSSLGERIRAYATNTDGAFPQTWKDLVEVGVIAEREIEFRDATWRGVRVTRTLRPIPSIHTLGDPIVVVETYGFESGDGSALYLSGKAFWEFDIRHIIESDNKLRRELGLPEMRFQEVPSEDP